LDVGSATSFVSGDGHVLVTVDLPEGVYAVAASISVSGTSGQAGTAVLTCSWSAGGDAEMYGPQPATMKDSEADLKDDLLALAPNAVGVGSGGGSLSLLCVASFPSASMTLTGTLLATQVTSVTVT
jgi:hypothetical protein